MKHFFCFFFWLLIVAVSPALGEERFQIPVGDSPQRGPANAAVTIVEFLDYQ